MLKYPRTKTGGGMDNWYTLRGIPSDSLTEDHKFRVDATVLPDPSNGQWHVYSGQDGTVQIDGRVLSISAMASTSAATVSISGETINMPANMGISLEPGGNLVDPEIVFTGTASYVVEVVR